MKKYIHNGSFSLESGESMDQLHIVYQTFGKTNAAKDNVVVVFHAISGDSNVMKWWPGLFGTGCIYNEDDYFIICANALGSPFGSSKPEDLSFPNFTVRDVVAAHLLLLSDLGITNIHTAIGGSFGGYQALELAHSYTGRIGHLILLATSARESAWGIAIHESQRIAMRTDSTFGAVDGGLAGMKAARAIAMLTYKTSQELIDNQTDDDQTLDNFKASSYINYQGDKFVKSFDALCYYYLTKCIDSHNMGRDRGGEVKALQNIQIPTLVIGFTSDTLVPVRFQKFLAEHIPNAIMQELQSPYGHDGFLKETDRISHSISQFYKNNNLSLQKNKRVVLKFGGTSLYGRNKLDNVISIIKAAQSHDPIAIVVSARGKSTDKLIELYDLAKEGLDFNEKFVEFESYLKEDGMAVNIAAELKELSAVLYAIHLLKEDNEFAYDRVVAYGELISAKCIVEVLQTHGYKSTFVDARSIIHTRKVFDNFEVCMDESRTATQKLFATYMDDQMPIITGFIASSEKGRTVTLGRNGSNYTATLIASYIHAKEVQNWTDVRGVYSSNPNVVSNAVQIKTMSYKEANEMANFGVNLLHPKTILPLMQSKIPLVIRSTLHPDDSGTTINHTGADKNIKAVTMIEDIAMVAIEGSELSEKVGIDARIFSALWSKEVSVKMISQASSERGIGFVISSGDVQKTELILNEEFHNELRLGQISSIRINEQIGIVSVIGRHNYALEKAISALRQNSIWMYLISNSISGEHISLVVDKSQLEKAVSLVHDEVFR